MLSRRLSDRTRAAMDEASDFMELTEGLQNSAIIGWSARNFQALQLYDWNIDQ
jgi:hypothetical protein